MYDKGDQVRLTVTFKNSSDVATNPTSVVLKVKDPDGTTTTYTYGVDASVVRDSTGVYHYDLTLAVAGGEYSYRWEGTGTVVAAGESTLDVERSEF